MQKFVKRTFSSEMHRPSAAQLWHIPLDTTLPMVPGVFARLLPLDAQETSYLAAAERILSLSARPDNAPLPGGLCCSHAISVFVIFSPFRLYYKRKKGENKVLFKNFEKI